MKNFRQLLETYVMVLVHPFRVHEQFRHRLPLPGQDGHLYPPLTLAESLGMSWVFALIQGLFKIVILSFFLKTFLNFQTDNFPLIQDLITSSGISTYYFLLFSTALNVIFYPISALILTEVWAWFIRLYTRWLNPNLPAHEIADQVTTHALSSNIFSVIPYVGDLIQPIFYHFLLYAGLRSNLGASRSLAWVILLTPMILGLMLLSALVLIVFYLV
jgi:hypothetical protein